MVSQKFLDLLSDPQANNIYLLTLTGYDPALGSEITRYHGLAGSSGAFISAPGDSPANTIFVPDVRGVEWVEDLFGPDGEPGGRSAPAEIRVTLINRTVPEGEPGAGTGVLDYYSTIDWRTLRLQLGGDGFALAEFVDVFAGRGPGGPSGVEQTESTVTLIFRDAQYLLDKEIQQNVYAGTGGIEGGPDLKGKKKPWAIGPAENVAPHFLGHLPDGAGGFLPAFRFHHGAVKPFDAAYHRFFVAGVVVPRDASFPPALGKWYLDDTQGVAWFNGALSGDVTMDVLGALGVDTLADAVRYVAACCGIADPAGIDTPAFDQADIDQPAPVQFWLPDGGNALDVLDRLCGPLGFSFGMTTDEKVTLRQFKGPQGSPVLTLNAQQIEGTQGMPRQSTTPPAWRQIVGHSRCWTVQDASRLALVYTNAVTNGTFAVDANWSKAANSTIAADVLSVAAGTAGSDTQDLTLSAQQDFTLQVDVTRSAGQAQLRMEGVDLGPPIVASGAVRRDFRAQGTLNQTLELAHDAAFAGTFDNVLVLPTRLEFVQNEYRDAVEEDAGIKTVFAQAGEDRRDTALAFAADAQAEAARQFALRSVAREVYTPTCFVHPLALALGDEIRIAYPRNGLAEGKDFILVGRRAALPGKRVEVTVWG